MKWAKVLSPFLPIFLITCGLFEEEHPFQGITRTEMDSLGNMIIIKEDPDDWRIMLRPEPDPNVPIDADIDPSFPNPTSGSTTMWLGIPESTYVHVWIIDRNRSVVKTIFDEGKSAGYWSAVWHLEDEHGRRVEPDTYRCKYQWYLYRSVDSVLTLIEVFGYGDIRVE
ncbi:hypothetical protein ACFL32_00255 [Candidatus Neomarinimicrobiota bacterium]